METPDWTMIPCKECITFALCNAKLKETIHNTVLYTLYPECSLIREYTFVGIDFVSMDSTTYSQEKLDHIRHYFYHYNDEVLNE